MGMIQFSASLGDGSSEYESFLGEIILPPSISASPAMARSKRLFPEPVRPSMILQFIVRPTRGLKLWLDCNYAPNFCLGSTRITSCNWNLLVSVFSAPTIPLDGQVTVAPSKDMPPHYHVVRLVRAAQVFLDPPQPEHRVHELCNRCPNHAK